MKTLNFELSKILTEWWYLDNIETEYFYWYWAIFNNLSAKYLE